MAINLVKDFSGGSTTYIEDHQDNYTAIEDAVNALEVALGGSIGSILAVPLGLEEIFDRDGVIGIDSFRIPTGNIGGQLLGVAPGAAWIGSDFRTNVASQTIDLTPFADGPLHVNIAAAGTANVTAASGANTVYSFTWASSTTTISNRTLEVAVLFDGDDYSAQLSSTALSASYTKVADRFDDIENRLGVLGSFYMEDPDNHSGFNFAYKAGRVRNDNVVSDTASGTITLPSVQTNYVEVNPSTGVVVSNTSGFTSNFIPLFTVVTDGIGIDTVTDKRTWASLGGGGGGGHAQNTDTGTDNSRFDLLLGQSTGAANAALGVDRGSDPTVEVRWNETTNKWQFTNDGVTYEDLGGLDLGSQELSKFVAIEDPLMATEVLNIGTGASYTLVDLTGLSEFASAQVDGVSGLVLRVQYWDDAASATTNVKFRKPINPAVSPAVAYNVQAKTTGDPDEQQLFTVLLEGQGIDASNTFHIGFEYLATTSSNTAGHLRVWVTGFFAKVTGVGTQDRTFAFASNTVAPSTQTDFNLTDFVNRGLIHKFKFEDLGASATAGVDVSLYSRDTFASSTLLYQVDAIDPTIVYEDFMPTWVSDLDLTKELHMRIDNTDGSASGLYTITIELEQFA